MQKSLLLHNDWLINKISSSVSSFRRVHTIINFNTKSNGSISLFLSFFFIFCCCCASRENGSNCRLWVTPIVLYSSSINEQVPSVARPPPCILAYIYTAGSGGNHASGFLMAFVWMALQPLPMQQGKGTKKKEGNKNCWITLPDRFMRRTREKPPSAMTWQGRSPARIAKLLSPVKFEKICVPLRPHLLRPRTSPVVANGSF